MLRPAAMPLQAGQGPRYGDVYLPSRPESVSWGVLPNAATAAAATVRSGQTVCFDTISHEGILADQGRDPRAFFGAAGIAAADILDDAAELAASGIEHDPASVGPHVISPAVAVVGARPGDVLEVEVLSLLQRTPYGVISNRHGRGALPGEMPAPPPGWPAEAPVPPVSLVAFTRGDVGVLPVGDGRELRFPCAPFLGIMGVAAATRAPVHSVPPGPHGGNLDVNLLGVGARLYLPVQVAEALFYVGDPHFAQGDGEVALTAFEAPLRATVRLTVHSDQRARDLATTLTAPWAETPDLHVILGLDPDLREAMKAATRNAIAFLGHRCAIPPAVALAYLSAAADFEVSQVVDRTTGIHCCLRKADLTDVDPTPAPAGPVSPRQYVP